LAGIIPEIVIVGLALKQSLFGKPEVWKNNKKKLISNLAHVAFAAKIFFHRY
jgi:hypothetical protein